jgi:hypothetical protein
MTVALRMSPDFAAELERKYFWWEAIGAAPRTEAHV